MFDIKCKRIDCEFNKDCFCSSKNLEVSKSTECKTYKPTSENPVSVESKLGQPPIRKNIKVDCKANCIFNADKECTANGITVQTCDDKSCPNCCTFQPK